MGGFICVFVQSLLRLIQFKSRAFIGVSELAAVLRSSLIQFSDVQPRKKFSLDDNPPFKVSSVVWSMVAANACFRIGVVFTSRRGVTSRSNI